MAVQVAEREQGKILVVDVTGKLEKQDYEVFAPTIDRLIEQHGKLRIVLETHDFQGWDAGALWADIKFNAKHFNDIERLAVIGEKKWEQGMATFCKPFTTAKVRYFDKGQATEAHRWIESD